MVQYVILFLVRVTSWNLCWNGIHLVRS